MKDFEYYKTKVPYPIQTEFVTVYGYTKGKCVWTVSGVEFKRRSEELMEQCAVIERDTNQEAFTAAKRAYQDDVARLTEEFMKDLIEEFGLTGHPKAQQAYNLAWERGHSGGLHEVYSNMGDLAPLLVD